MRNELVEAVKKADKRPQNGFWAPGNYFNRCCHCKELFMGDKRAVVCAPCSYQDNEDKDIAKKALLPQVYALFKLVEGSEWYFVGFFCPDEDDPESEPEYWDICIPLPKDLDKVKEHPGW